MGFEDLEVRLKRCWQLMVPPPETALKVRVQARTQAQFKAAMAPQGWLITRRVLGRGFSFAALGLLVVSALGLIEGPFLGNQVVGQVESQDGVVEIIRGDQSVLVSGTQELVKGDWVRVGHRGHALITTPYFASAARAGTRLRLEQPDVVFLDKGRLIATHWQSSEISTDRGRVQTGDGSEVAVEVSETGETRVLPQHQAVAVFDLNNGHLLAHAGEEVMLRSDTVLAPQNWPKNLSLSNAQIEAILGKFAITRTKALTGIENLLLGERLQAHQEILSAEQTYRSIVQILESSRDLATKRRVNLEAIAMADVLPALQAKTDRIELLTEAASLQAVFEVLERHKNKIAFAPVDTGVQTYDRYVLLHYLASLGNAQQSRAIVSLAETYVISLLRKVQQSPLRMEQIAYLNQQVDALPANAQAERFLRALQNRLSPDLAAVLNEKLDYWF